MPDDNRSKMVDSPTSFRTADEAVNHLVGWSRWLFAPDQVVELRALKVRADNGRSHPEAGYFDGEHHRQMLSAAWNVTNQAEGVYATLNPLRPELVARRANRLGWAESGDSAKDQDVLVRRWLLIDVDPVRPSGISASDAEKNTARELSSRIRDELRLKDWPEPIWADSGNGFHLLYRIDLPTDDGGLIKRVLAGLAQRFDTPDAKVDQAVFNAARLVKLPGTMSRKGDPRPDRPHRRSRLLEVPAIDDPQAMAIVTAKQLESVAAPSTNRASVSSRARNDHPSSRLLVDQWLNDRRVRFRIKPEPDAKGRTVYVLSECPFYPDHRDPDSCIMQAVDGQMAAKCFHDRCREHGWTQFKAKIGPPQSHHYDPPLTRSRTSRHAPSTKHVPAESVPLPPHTTSNSVVSASMSVQNSSGNCETQERNESVLDTQSTSQRGVITIDESNSFVDTTIQQITSTLRTTGQYYIRSTQLVRIADETITPVLNAKELIGCVNALAEVSVINEKGAAQYKPLPVNYATTWIYRPDRSRMFPVITVYTRNPVYTQDWRFVSCGFDPASGIYAASPAIVPREGTEHLDALLRDFCFLTPGDRTNYISFMLTILLMPRFIGSKPAALFHGNQPNLGKTILAKVLSVLRDGRSPETVTYNPNDEEFEKSLGAVVRRGATTIIIDNAKGRKGRDPRIESACLERSITDEVLCFRLLGASDVICAENSHIFCITANTPEFSRDLVTRSVTIRLHHEGDPVKRHFTIADPVTYAQAYRLELLGELAGMVDRWLAAGRTEADTYTRFNAKGWGRIVGGILAHQGLDGFLANAETVAAEIDETRRDFGELVALMANDPRGWWTPTDLVQRAVQDQLFAGDLQKRAPHAQVTRFGLIASRYDHEHFSLPDDRIATFQKRQERKGTVYLVSITDPTEASRVNHSIPGPIG